MKRHGSVKWVACVSVLLLAPIIGGCGLAQKKERAEAYAHARQSGDAALQAYENEIGGIGFSENNKDMLRLEYAHIYAANAESQMATLPPGGSHAPGLPQLAAELNIGTGVIDIAGGFLTGQGISGGSAASLVFGLLSSANQSARESLVLTKYRAITVDGFRLMRFSDKPFASHADIETAFAEAAKLEQALFGCQPAQREPIGPLFSVRQNKVHARSYQCDGKMLTVRAIRIDEDHPLGATKYRDHVVSEMWTTDSDPSGLHTRLRPKIPDGWLAVFPTRDSQARPKVIVSAISRAIAFDPPPNPLKS